MLSRTHSRPLALASFVIGVWLVSRTAADGQPANVSTLRIGSTGSMTGTSDSAREKTGREILTRFIKKETGLNNTILPPATWEDLAVRMAKGDCQLGVFQGFEFAWAKEKEPQLKPLAVGVGGQICPVACVLVNKDDTAKDFLGLKGQELMMPQTSQGFLTLFLNKLCAAQNQKPSAFFKKASSSEQVEDILDDIVDGKVQVTVVDESALAAYKQQKPGRFDKLRVVARSQPFPPAVVAYFDSRLDQSTLQRFKKGLIDANQKEEGEMLLTMSRLTAFADVPADFTQVLAATLKAYPPPAK